MSKKIAILITDYFEDTEYTEPVEAFKQKGYEFTTIEMEKGKTAGRSFSLFQFTFSAARR